MDGFQDSYVAFTTYGWGETGKMPETGQIVIDNAGEVGENSSILSPPQ
jgi:hypothetical protein